MRKILSFLVGFGVLLNVVICSPSPAMAATYQEKRAVAQSAATLGFARNNIEAYQLTRNALTTGVYDAFRIDLTGEYDIAHIFDVILTELIKRPETRYSLDKATLAELGLKPSDSNAIKLRNGIRGVFRKLTHGNIRALINPKTKLYIYYAPSEQAFKSQLNAEPTGKPQLLLTSGHMMDFAFVDGVTLGSETAIKEMNPVIDKELKKFSANREADSVTLICNQCLDKSQVKKGLAFCYLAGLAKGNALRDQLLKTTSGRASLNGDPIAASAKH